jgi:hypothetical protein
MYFFKELIYIKGVLRVHNILTILLLIIFLEEGFFCLDPKSLPLKMEG